MERVERISEALGKVDAASYDEPAWAYVWDLVHGLARDGLADTGVRVVDEVARAQRDEGDPLPPIMAGGVDVGWAATPSEVVDWCADHGIPHDIGSSGRGAAIYAVFDDKPGDELRRGLKVAGFRWEKGSKRWVHKAFGQWAGSDKVKARRANGPEAQEETTEAQGGAAW